MNFAVEDCAPIAIIFAAVILIPYVIYKWFIPDLDYWEKQNVPCYKPGLFQKIMSTRKGLHVAEMELYKKYGRIYGRYDGRIPVLTVADPDLLKEVLEKNFRDFYNRRFIQFGDPIMDNILPSLNDENWKRVRNVLTPTFTTVKLKEMLSKVNACANRTVDILRQIMNNNEHADLERLFGAYVMDVIACCAFGCMINTLESPNDPFVRHARMFFETGFSFRAILAQNFPFVMRLFHIPIFNAAASTFFGDFTLQVIDERKKSKEPGVDFLQLLLEFMRESGSSQTSCPVASLDVHISDEQEQSESQRKYITKDELIAQCVMFFMAGYEAITSLLQFTMYSLAVNQDIQDKLYREIQDTIGDKVTVTYDDINDMNYLDAVIAEALRFSTACVRMERQVTRDHYLESHKIQLKRGQLISLPFFCIHRDPEWYPDPEKFDPERFTKEAKTERNKYVYLPFGIGHRACIGNRFALMETKLCIILILREFKINLSPKMKVPLSFKDKQGQLVSEKVLVRVENRL